MNARLRTSLGALLALGAIGAAHADIAPYSSGDGSLYFNLLDTTNQKSYVLDLNIPISTFNSTGTYSFSADSNLQSFLSGGSGNYMWSVFGGDSIGSTAGSVKYFTTLTNLGSLDAPTNARLYTLYKDEGMLTSINAMLPDDGSVRSLVSNSTDPTFYTTQYQTWNNTGDFVANQTGFGSVGFFSLTTNGGTILPLGSGNPATKGALGNWTLASDGTLSYAAPSTVPLPAAVWLMFSGLAGLVGIGRRNAKLA